ncbi:hypothetical protein LRP49_14815 [Enterovibrio sp. ZSDZ35]|uniref:VanZ like family protein n=1 Tax=Enterovibrio qingdaonensis TaxID=2899818 RepID=A0ABT5QN80_9GAMM|nr:hypothetical protein [Enterovibrio sp. ZSDZ35]MDD1782441.1 hypothetical protein [Enterovibrio sp. ZSDZ35]
MANTLSKQGMLHVMSALLVLVAFISLFSPLGLSELNVDRKAFFFGHGDLLLHFALFHFAAWLVVPLGRKVQPYVYIGLLALGVFSEWAQDAFIANRDGSVNDAMANVVAVLLVVIFQQSYLFWKARRA